MYYKNWVANVLSAYIKKYPNKNTDTDNHYEKNK